MWFWILDQIPSILFIYINNSENINWVILFYSIDNKGKYMVLKNITTI
jgi:hypothetical protein